MNKNRNILLQNLIFLRENFASGSITIEECQKNLSAFIYLSDIDEQEKLAKKYDNELEFIIFTMNFPRQMHAILKALDEIINVIQRSIN